MCAKVGTNKGSDINKARNNHEDKFLIHSELAPTDDEYEGGAFLSGSVTIPVECQVVKVNFPSAHFNSSLSYLPHDGSQMGFSITQNLWEFTFLVEATFPV